MFPGNPPAALSSVSPYKRVSVFVKFCFHILIISHRSRGIGESWVFGWGGEWKKNIFIGSINLYFWEAKMIVIKKNNYEKWWLMCSSWLLPYANILIKLHQVITPTLILQTLISWHHIVRIQHRRGVRQWKRKYFRLKHLWPACCRNVILMCIA